MAQFNCPICNEGFNQKSRLERHVMTSHPAQASSAADMESALSGADFPLRKTDLLELARSNNQSTDLLQQLPDEEYRDAAEVARALGEVKSHTPASQHQPSKLVGESAMQAPSAARIASLFEGITFPASADDLKNHVRNKADESTLQIVERFRSKTYHSMADVTKELENVNAS